MLLWYLLTLIATLFTLVHKRYLGDKTINFGGWSLESRNQQTIRKLLPLWGFFYDYYFRVQTDGWHHIPEEKVLLVGSHNGGLAAPDMVMCMYDWFRRFGTNRLVYGLMHANAWQINPRLAQLAAETGAIAAHPKMAISAFQKNASVLVYPGGAQDVFRPYSQRHKINLAGRKGFIKLALREKVKIIPIISTGAHDTLFVLDDFYDLAQQVHKNLGLPWLLNLDPQVFPVYFGLPWGISVGPLPNIPLPVQIKTRVCPPIIFETYGKDASRDRSYVDSCYDLVVEQMQRQLDDLSQNS